MPAKRPPTIRDVAAAAGVSTATVSKYLNGLQRFTPEVEKRLAEAIASLGYRLNPQARSMVTGQTRAVGLAVQDVRNPHFANIIKGANRVALAQDYNLLVVDVQERAASERQLLEALSGRVDGLVVSSRLPDESLAWLGELGKPVVFFGRRDAAGIRCVRTDGHRAAYMLGRHLLETGRRRIAYLGFPQARWDGERLAGLAEALQEAGLSPITHAVEWPTMEGGQREASALLLRNERPDAVVAYNDLVAIGLMHEAQTLGIRVPEDVAIAGFDDIPVAAFMHPPLSSVNMRSEEQGEAAMNLLLEAVRDKSGIERDVLLEPRLVPRASTARVG
ncbi:MAG: LacI family transcriptional regulator [Candidatus Dactylopiibacterium carminicum]|uniref:LacI family transcriptional regulator n=1 Tax=Candidatus Dactylopiibacterium carminicum TaxID=857335 RepID=A0A272EU96_9RHOO|nr:LacI family DNA-binding transcriptional regulator [Candidatus Dactylopiibacterium carminicum]KAF7599727.1 LacI family transcriptional regulator [Candidatus Dactylopiibacterium carminicum]PAS93663.1 MAG: LacI family transcriptional regulator [Candidatus Dactylopiibacterium carminicum]PAS97531.1 MAG: LacI family transcriptional regulator [Candidatus Dactylopiibacterium carminicum]PAS99729.1 MAG: LacI family transcriptional regulator [Candidatus Dactylopiibacterium carminicum]